MARRGKLTSSIEAKMIAFLKRETSQDELRLYPYLLYVMVNDQKIDPNKINGVERSILSLLRAEGHIEGGASGLAISREFYDFASDVVWDAYVAYREAT